MPAMGAGEGLEAAACWAVLLALRRASSWEVR